MERKLFFYQILGFLFTSLAGVFLHFAYTWSNQSPLIAPFAAVNESIWEHMKLLFFPMFLYAVLEHQFSHNSQRNFWCVKFSGILLGLFVIPVFYYTYTGMLGVNNDVINVSIFFIANAITYLTETILFKKERLTCTHPTFAFFTLCFLAFLL